MYLYLSPGLSMCRPADHPEYTYMAYILYIFIAVDLYLALGLYM